VELISDQGRAVREMFASIAARYDLLNHLLSGNVDRRWRRVCAAEVRKRIAAGRPRILDVGCGTADLALAFAGAGTVVGCDFCHPMLLVGKKKAGRAAVALAEADALVLPFLDATFDAVVSAFVVRNLADLDAGLVEMARVLRRGAVLGVLDFAMPEAALFGAAYRFYFTRVLPAIGSLVSGVDGPYRYLPESVRAFPRPPVLRDRIAAAGFARAEYRLLTCGIAALYTAIRE
jgi:demethylmenaquinone methyltransferase/2-methoxy-6-polyprenyl-1,4-benzoquinol methylase